MATAVATKPAPPHQKIKRPPPVQTSLNGVKSSQSSPSPSMSSKKPPSGLIQPQTASSGNGSMATMNGGASRTSNRRRDSQRPGDIAGRLVKTGKNGQTEVSDRRLPKRKPEPYGIEDTLVLLEVANMDIGSQNGSIHFEKISKCLSFTHTPSTSYAFQIRPARWQFLVQLTDESYSSGYQILHGTS